MNFHELGVIGGVLDTLEALGIREATPLQERILKVTGERHPVVALAPRGAGKSTALLLALIRMLETDRSGGLRALVVTPADGVEEAIGRFEVLSRTTELKALAAHGTRTDIARRQIGEQNPDVLFGTLSNLGELIERPEAVRMVFFDRMEAVLSEPDGEKRIEALLERFGDTLRSATLDGEAHLKEARRLIGAATARRGEETLPEPYGVELFMAVDARRSPEALLLERCRTFAATNVLYVVATENEARQSRERFAKLGALEEAPAEGDPAFWVAAADSLPEGEFSTRILAPSLVNAYDYARLSFRTDEAMSPLTVGLVTAGSLRDWEGLVRFHALPAHLMNPDDLAFARAYDAYEEPIDEDGWEGEAESFADPADEGEVESADPDVPRKTLTIRSDYVAVPKRTEATEILITEPLSSSSAALRASERRSSASERLTHQMLGEGRQGRNRRGRMPHLPSDGLYPGLRPVRERPDWKAIRAQKAAEKAERRERLKLEKARKKAEREERLRREKAEREAREAERRAERRRRAEERAAKLAEMGEASDHVPYPPEGAEKGLKKVFFAALNLAKSERLAARRLKLVESAESDLAALREANLEGVAAAAEVSDGEAAKHDSPVAEAKRRLERAKAALRRAERMTDNALQEKRRADLRYASAVPEELRIPYGITEEVLAEHAKYVAEHPAPEPKTEGGAVSEIEAAAPQERSDKRRPARGERQRNRTQNRKPRPTSEESGEASGTPISEDGASDAIADEKPAKERFRKEGKGRKERKEFRKDGKDAKTKKERRDAKTERGDAARKGRTEKKRFPKPAPYLDEAGDVNGNRALPEEREPEYPDDDFGNSIHYKTLSERKAERKGNRKRREADYENGPIPSPLTTSFGAYQPSTYGALSLPQTMPGLTGRETAPRSVFGSGLDPYSGAKIPPMRSDDAGKGRKGPKGNRNGNRFKGPKKGQRGPKKN